MRIEDDLGAWVDGQLAEPRRQRFERAMARDPALAARAAALERQNRWLRESLDELLYEPLPQRLVDAARRPAPDAGSDRIRDTNRRGGSQWSDGVRSRVRAAWDRGAPWMRWVLVAQFAAIVALGVAVGSLREPVASNRTLGSVRASGEDGRIVVVFDPKITEAEMRRILRVAGARVVDGPTQADAWVLALAPDHVAAALAMLASQRSVQFAAPFGAADKR